jgi:hypothetical protein
MMKIKKPLVLGVVASIALSTFAAVTPAFADPVSNSYSIVGSDTLQASVNALTNGTDLTGSRVRLTAGGSTLGNFDAFAPGFNAAGGTIQTKPAGVVFGRPSGSGAGVDALVASINGTNYSANGVTANISGQVDIARSSAGPSAQVSNGILSWVPFGRDAVAYAYVAGTTADGANVANLTAAQLNTIYNATADQVINGTTVKAYLPQSGSGTRKFFLGAIGITNNTAGSAVYTNGNTLAENDASVFPLAATISAGTAYVVPFSAASWVAQSNAAAPNTIPATDTVKLGTPLKDASNAALPAYTGTAPSLTPNPSYYANTTFGRDTYLVVEAARLDSTNAKYDVNLANLLNPSRPSSLVNMSSSGSSAGGVKRTFGFLTVNDTTVLRSNTK